MKIGKVRSNEVVIVGKITVKTADPDFDFYAKSWGITDFSVPDCYVIYNDSYNENTYLSLGGKVVTRTNGECNTFTVNEYFFSKRKIKNHQLIATSPIKWCFFSSEKFNAYLPFQFQATIPDDCKYVYVGDFEYTVEGSDFHPVHISLSDSFDYAKEELGKILETPIPLCRVEIYPITQNKNK